MEELPTGVVVASLGFALGIVFGGTAQKTNFCTMGAISDIVFMENWNRFRAWMLAAGVAILGSQFLYQTGVIDLSKAIYLTPNFGWFGAILGGLMFGFGMTLGSGCGNKTLVRLGAGNLKSLVVFMFLGFFAYMTLRGLIGMARVEMEALTVIDLKASGMKTQGIPEFLASLFSMPLKAVSLLVTVVMGGGLVLFAFKSAEFRSSTRDMAAGIIIGLLVVAAWYLTGVIGFDEFEPVPLASFTFIAPAGDSLQYLMTFSGASINFGIAENLECLLYGLVSANVFSVGPVFSALLGFFLLLGHPFLSFGLLPGYLLLELLLPFFHHLLLRLTGVCTAC